MERKLNCWEFKRCGRQPQGEKTAEMGVCSAAADERLDGEHGGVNGGRACWVVAGTLCGGKTQGSFAQKMDNCMNCDFYKTVKDEEGREFKMSVFLLKKLKEAEPVLSE
jgi:hypothetical protein